MPATPPLFTPDDRYLIVRGRLWRVTNPHLPDEEATRYRKDLMHARRTVGLALKQDDPAILKAARGQVDIAKKKLGERGPVWWNDGAPDYNRYLVKNTPYAEWYHARTLVKGSQQPDKA